MAEDRIHLPNCAGDTFFKREFIEIECKSIPRDVPLGYFTGPDLEDFELNPELFPKNHRPIEYRREPWTVVDGVPMQSDWFVRVDAESR